MHAVKKLRHWQSTVLAPSTTENQLTNRNNICLCEERVPSYFHLARVTSH